MCQLIYTINKDLILYKFEVGDVEFYKAYKVEPLGQILAEPDILPSVWGPNRIVFIVMMLSVRRQKADTGIDIQTVAIYSTGQKLCYFDE